MISIIVPIFNKEKYLKKCIESLINQSMKEIEIILVNDGSEDMSKDICIQYSKKDNRVYVVNKENGGVSSARNIGLKNAKGEYILFVDPDDYLELDAIEYLYNLIKKYNADIACYKMKNNLIINKTEDENIEVYRGIEIINEQVKGGRFLYSSCNKLYSKKLFKKNTIKFKEEIRFAEDALFNLSIMIEAKTLVSSNIKKYNYIINEESTVKYVTEKRVDILKAQIEMIKLLKEEYKNNIKYIIKDYVNSTLMIISEVASNNYQRDNIIIRSLKNELNKNYISLNCIYKIKEIKNLDKIKFTIAKVNILILLKIYKIKYKDRTKNYEN